MPNSLACEDLLMKTMIRHINTLHKFTGKTPQGDACHHGLCCAHQKLRDNQGRGSKSRPIRPQQRGASHILFWPVRFTSSLPRFLTRHVNPGSHWLELRSSKRSVDRKKASTEGEGSATIGNNVLDRHWRETVSEPMRKESGLCGQ